MFRSLLAAVCLASLAASPLPAQVINEMVVNHLGTDFYEFLEVSGTPSTDYSNLTIVELDGDAAGDPGADRVGMASGVHRCGGDLVEWVHRGRVSDQRQSQFRVGRRFRGQRRSGR